MYFFFQAASWLSWVFEKVVLVMVVYFVISIVNSMAQSYHKRQSKQTQRSKTSQDWIRRACLPRTPRLYRTCHQDLHIVWCIGWMEGDILFHFLWSKNDVGKLLGLNVFKNFWDIMIIFVPNVLVESKISIKSCCEFLLVKYFIESKISGMWMLCENCVLVLVFSCSFFN